MDSANSRRALLQAGIGTVAALAERSAFGATQDLTALSLKEATDLLRRKIVSPVDLTRACLERIEKYNRAINAFITITGDSAMATARAMEVEAHRGRWRGPLHGIPIALKDNIDTKGIRTTAASELFKDRVPAEDAEVTRRLKQAGAILIGKLNMHEFAYGPTSAISYFGPVHNPWALDRISGGSSGGSAAAIAANMCFGTLGTDTGGSIRIPSCYCGVVGLMPTYGRVSNRGVIPMAWTLDHVGPICKSVEDAALMLGVIAGYDASDPTTVDMSVPDYSRAFKLETSQLRVGIPRASFFDNLDTEYAQAIDTAIGVLRKLTASVKDVQIPDAPPAPVIWGPETYAYHAKWLKESPEKYQKATRELMIRADDIKPEVYAYARRQTDLVRREIDKVFANVDLLVTPTMKSPPGLISASLNQAAPPAPGPPRSPGAAITSPGTFDVYGIPAITVPCGFTRAGLPVGLQISGAHFTETTVLALAHAYEKATSWHSQRPPLPHL